MLFQNVRYSLRLLRKSPGFTFIAVATLAVGIGANTTAFGLVKTVFVAELPVPAPETLRQFEWAGHRDFSDATFRYVHDHVAGFSTLTCVTGQSDATLGRGDREEQVTVFGAYLYVAPTVLNQSSDKWLYKEYVAHRSISVNQRCLLHESIIRITLLKSAR